MLTAKYLKYIAEMTPDQVAEHEKALAEYERQGMDVSAIRAAVADRERQLAAEIEQREQMIANNTVLLDKLAPFKRTPREVESEFFNDTAGKAPWFGKDKWREKYRNAPIVFGAIVQANNALWSPDDWPEDHCRCVCVFATDDAHRHDAEWLSELANKVSELKDASHVPAESQAFINVLRNDQSYLCFKLAPSLAGTADAWCTTLRLEDQSHLPNGFLPALGVLPFLLLAAPKEDYEADLQLIPAKYCT